MFFTILVLIIMGSELGVEMQVIASGSVWTNFIIGFSYRQSTLHVWSDTIHSQKGQHMSIEKIERAAVPEVAGNHSGSMIARDSDKDGFMSVDELKLKNKVEDQVLKGADLDGDGIVSPRETVLNSSDTPLDQEIDINEAKKVVNEVSKILDENRSATKKSHEEEPSAAEEYSKAMSQLINSLGLSRANTEDLFNRLKTNLDLSVEA